MKCRKCGRTMKKRYLELTSKRKFNLPLSSSPYYFKCYACNIKSEITSRSVEGC